MARADDVLQAIIKEGPILMKRGPILGALIAGALLISAVAQDDHLHPPTSGGVTATAPAETSNIVETPATDSQVALTPRDLLSKSGHLPARSRLL